MKIGKAKIRHCLLPVLIAGGLILLVMVGCGSVEEDPMWAKLSGRWETHDPRYEGCFLEFGKGMLIFRNPSSAPDINHIDKIEKKSERSQVYYVIHYHNQDNLQYSLPIYYAETPEGAMILYKNRKKLAWIRSEAKEP